VVCFAENLLWLFFQRNSLLLTKDLFGFFTKKCVVCFSRADGTLDSGHFVQRSGDKPEHDRTAERLGYACALDTLRTLPLVSLPACQVERPSLSMVKKVPSFSLLLPRFPRHGGGRQVPFRASPSHPASCQKSTTPSMALALLLVNAPVTGGRLL
jgi:hypothetical protein